MEHTKKLKVICSFNGQHKETKVPKFRICYLYSGTARNLNVHYRN